MIIGYMRPYHSDFDCKNQRNLLQNANCTVIIEEKHSSAKKRIELNNMISSLNKGDTIIVSKLFSLADSTHHLSDLLDCVNKKQAYLKSLDEGIDISSSSKYDFMDIVKYLVQFQSDMISEKTKIGLDEAKKKGIETGRPRKPDENVQRAISMYQSKKYSLAEIKQETGISKSTLYRYLEH